ncbi:MAG: hypothetical protein IKB99_03210, partial [Lentisphaeria bacterium]|nr:hypothetical protein [Lentisphaeria bacterium]
YQSRPRRTCSPRRSGAQTGRTSLVKLLAPVLTGFVLGFAAGVIAYCWVHIISQTRQTCQTSQTCQTITK